MSDDVTGEFDPRILEACLMLYERAPSGQVVSLVRAWVANGDDPAVNARQFVSDGRLTPRSA